MPLSNWNPLIYTAFFVSEAFQRTIETYGALDIVINNAGIFNDVEWEKEVDINLVSRIYLYCMHICRARYGTSTG
jgi:NAD(P)-dependent dehydrogenase (short-subunit alcohol dehydrogenase family)